MADVTIGIPVYNGDKYLHEALESICAQGCESLSILISDNASTDNTSEIIKYWADRDSRIRVHRQPRNIGALANYLWLIENADSRFFQYCAYDDKWSQDYSARLSAALLAAPGAILAVGTTRQEQVTGELRRSLPPPGPRFNSYGVGARIAGVRAGWFYGLYDRAAILPILRRCALREDAWGFDMMVLLPLLLEGRIVGDPEAVFHQRMTGASNTTHKPASSQAQYAHFRRALSWAREEIAGAQISTIERWFAGLAAWRFAERSSVRISKIASNYLRERHAERLHIEQWKDA